MDFLILGRAVVDADDGDTPELDEAHWSYMDAFAGRMTARGPTLSPDRQTWTGSLHVVDLPDLQAAQEFAVNDPYHRAGLFADHLVRRFDDLLGRTMWDFTRRDDDLPFLVLADGGNDTGPRKPAAAPVSAALAERLVVRGLLGTPQAPGSSGVVLALVAPGPDDVRAMIAAEPAVLDGRPVTQLHAWEFGGRR